MKTRQNSALPPELRNLVHHTVALLGEVIQRELGPKKFEQIESLRRQMSSLRGESSSSSRARSFAELHKVYLQIEKCTRAERRDLAKSFALMLELTNICENAYRSFRLSEKNVALARVPGETSLKVDLPDKNPEAIIYVLTAHPTEARAPQNIVIFHQIQNVLIQFLSRPRTSDSEFSMKDRETLKHWIEVAWKSPIVRDRAPQVKDEAEYIYSVLFREDVFWDLLDLGSDKIPFLVRTWVGGDKDGHPGVDEKTLLQSLTLSRRHLLGFAEKLLSRIQHSVALTEKPLRALDFKSLRRLLAALKVLKTGDAERISLLRKKVVSFQKTYLGEFGSLHPDLRRLDQIFFLFPGLVVPLELRESSDILMLPEKRTAPIAIDRMLRVLAQISKGGHPDWYARGFIISMTGSLAHIQAAARKQKRAFGDLKLPIIPLFENAEALASSSEIMRQMTSDPQIRKAATAHWGAKIEMMVGYSDSAKEAGSLASRVAIAKALPNLDRVCRDARLTPVFFHGSGGSIDRGGGSIEDQTSWWPASALRRYKVTVQGEMIDRSLSTSAIATGQIRKIFNSARHGLESPARNEQSPALARFTEKASGHYRKQIASASFLEVVEKATPYSYLKYLKIGSRPTKRSSQLTVAGLRAIPWILCWTQTRALFPVWWGLGSAWEETSPEDRSQLSKAFRELPVFISFVKALGFTLAKIELAVWKIYLDKSRLSPDLAERAYQEFEEEFLKTERFFRELTSESDFLWFRPWLGESILLRSPMIHPLNILQILAEKDRDPQLLRLTVMGISSGMMTTG